MIFQIPWIRLIHWICVPFGKNSNKHGSNKVKFTELRRHENYENYENFGIFKTPNGAQKTVYIVLYGAHKQHFLEKSTAVEAVCI